MWVSNQQPLFLLLGEKEQLFYGFVVFITVKTVTDALQAALGPSPSLVADINDAKSKF